VNHLTVFPSATIACHLIELTASGSSGNLPVVEGTYYSSVQQACEHEGSEMNAGSDTLPKPTLRLGIYLVSPVFSEPSIRIPLLCHLSR